MAKPSRKSLVALAVCSWLLALGFASSCASQTFCRGADGIARDVYVASPNEDCVQSVGPSDTLLTLGAAAALEGGRCARVQCPFGQSCVASTGACEPLSCEYGRPPCPQGLHCDSVVKLCL